MDEDKSGFVCKKEMLRVYKKMGCSDEEAEFMAQVKTAPLDRRSLGSRSITSSTLKNAQTAGINVIPTRNLAPRS